MSFDALAWAAKQNTGSSGTKLVLLGLAECADRKHNLAFPSVAALVEFSSLDRKSVISNLAKLEEVGLITDTGRRAGATKQIKIYQLNLESIPKTGQSQKRNSSENPDNSPKNGTRNKSEPGSEAKASSHVAPEELLESKKAAVGSALKAAFRDGKKHLIPADWSPPAIADLPPMARACAAQWPEASYRAEAEAFGCYWRSERKMKADWRDTWANRIIARHEAVMRAQKYGHGPPGSPSATILSAQQWRERAEWYASRGNRESAEECRKKAVELEQSRAA